MDVRAFMGTYGAELVPASPITSSTCLMIFECRTGAAVERKRASQITFPVYPMAPLGTEQFESCGDQRQGFALFQQ